MGIKAYVEEKKKALDTFAAKQRSNKRVRQATELRRLKQERLSAELDADIRVARRKEKEAITKAHSKCRPKQSASLFGFDDTGSIFGSSQSPKKGRKTKSTFDFRF